MSRRPVIAVLVSAALLSACGTGLQAQTYKPRTPGNGTDASVGPLALRNLAVEAPEGGLVINREDPAVLTGVLVNSGDEGDSLASASTDVASTARLAVSGASVTSVPVPAGGSSGTEWAIVLEGLTKELRVGEYISLTLTFDKAGRTTVQVPIRAGESDLENREEAQHPYGEHG